MSFIGDKINLNIGGQVIPLVGGEFREMLGFVKTLPGSSYEDRVWTLQQCLSEVRDLAKAQGWQLLVSEDDQLEKELEEITKLQQQALWFREEMRYRSQKAWETYTSYSFKSKSRYKAAAGVEAGRLNHAVEYAALPIDQLSEPQIATLKAAVSQIQDEGAIPLKGWFEWFSVKTPETCDWAKVCQPHVVPLVSIRIDNNLTDQLQQKGEPIFEDYIAGLAAEWELDRALIPSVICELRTSPTGNERDVLVFMLKQPEAYR